MGAFLVRHGESVVGACSGSVHSEHDAVSSTSLVHLLRRIQLQYQGVMEANSSIILDVI